MENFTAFTENLLGIYDSIKGIRKDSKLPGFLKRFYTSHLISKCVKQYEKSMKDIQLSYDIVHDFARFYLNTIDNVNKYFQYKLLKKGFSEVAVSKDFSRFVIIINGIKYDIRFRKDSEIEVNKIEKEKHDDGERSFNIIYINHGYLEDKEFDTIIKNEIIQYISYYLRTVVFTD